ncbi:phosphate ABC transporter substrate-binding protein, PhoT family [Filimonas lacunae]|uniref:Phosphate ABC transporter substrate-binding protein, PhoT family n=1 Tax=Filimonas lacunae TaxID=477680 RepID=A0A173MNJ7_9BACT|nr:substrate-binding domain-containing protein [Filimonas lacunae]BAV08971.1 phosphate ABC transporter, phosphate-binding component [Filimonas lacunae]SIS65009.1 phosphate ABC transporter substrate-binding protein, PhoT family [Filimonas lacunae]
MTIYNKLCRIAAGILLPGIIMMQLSCGGSGNKKALPQKWDSPKEGVIHVSVDESFKPVIDEQVKVYESSFPNARILVEYKPEAECFRDLQKDSTRMIIVARDLTQQEIAYYKQQLEYQPKSDVLAFDAVDIVINKEGKDSMFTRKQLLSLLNGEQPDKQVVLDGKNATSTVRYLMDSVLHGTTFGKNVTAAADSKAVLDFVASNKNAIGFVGSSWIGNQQDPAQVAYNNKIKLAMVECRNCEKDIFAKPSQATLTSDQYPLVRPLFYILKENSTGLGTGFMNFMSLERGQLIFRRSLLVPAKMYFGIRKGDLSDD